MKITLRKLSTKDLATLAQRTINTSESGNYPVINGHPLLAELKLKYADYDAVYTKMAFSGKGNDVANSDNERDIAYTTLKAFLNSYRKMLTLPSYQSAQDLYQIFKQFGLNLDRLSYSSQSAQMKKLIEELEKPENTQKIKDLKLTIAFNEMKDKQTAFEAIFAEQAGANADLRKSEKCIRNTKRSGENPEIFPRTVDRNERRDRLETLLQRCERTGKSSKELQPATDS